MRAFMVKRSLGGYAWDIQLITCDEQRAKDMAADSEHLHVDEVIIEDIGKAFEALSKERKY